MFRKVHCRISIACYFLYEFEIKMFMDASRSSKKYMGIIIAIFGW